MNSGTQLEVLQHPGVPWQVAHKRRLSHCGCAKLPALHSTPRRASSLQKMAAFASYGRSPKTRSAVRGSKGRAGMKGEGKVGAPFGSNQPCRVLPKPQRTQLKPAHTAQELGQA